MHSYFVQAAQLRIPHAVKFLRRAKHTLDRLLALLINLSVLGHIPIMVRKIRIILPNVPRDQFLMVFAVCALFLFGTVYADG